MIEYYRIPKNKSKIPQSQILTILDEAQLKDVIYDKSIQKAKILNFKNSNIKDESLLYLKKVQVEMHIFELNLCQNFSFITDKAIEMLCTLNIKNLKKLNISDNAISDQSVALISQSTTFIKLQELKLYGNADISSESMVILGQSPVVTKLKVLDLHATSVDDDGMGFFLKSINSSCLEELNLSMNWKRITDKTLYAMGISKSFSQLKKLNLEDCNITDIGVDELCQSENMSTLIHLNINNSIKQKNNQITDKSLSSLAFSKYLINLVTLQMRNTDISAKGLKTLAVSYACQKIQTFRISYCEKLFDEACSYLGKIIEMQSLKKLHLNNTRISKEQFQKFQAKYPHVQYVY